VKRIFLDANVIFTAAHNPEGKAAMIIELSRHGHWRLITSRLAWEEARRNIRIKFPECLSRMDAFIKDIRVVPHCSRKPCPIDLPAKDQPIFQAALEGRATHLLTGDMAHFGPFMNQAEKTGGIRIQTVSDFLTKNI